MSASPGPARDDDHPASPAVHPRRRWRLPVVGEPLVAVLAAVGVGLWLVWTHHPRKGLATIALAMLGAAFLRLVLPPRDAGLLVVRSRVLDVVLLLVLAGAVIALAVVQNFPGHGR